MSNSNLLTQQILNTIRSGDVDLARKLAAGRRFTAYQTHLFTITLKSAWGAQW